MGVKKGLGRGLDSLFGDFEDFSGPSVVGSVKDDDKEKKENPAYKTNDKTAESETSEPLTKEVSISLIDRNENQPRKRFDEKTLSELAQSIKTHGIIQPLVLNKNGNRYLIVSGERRFRAAKIAGLSSVPAVIKNYTPREIKEIAIIENLQREDLNPIESARAIKQLVDEYKLTQETVADKIGKSRPAVANTLRLLTLPDEIIELIEQNRLSAGHARTLIGLENISLQLELAKLSCDNKISVRELEKYIKKMQNAERNPKVKIEQSLEIKDFTKQMQNIFATKVSVLGNDKRGRIYIDYYNTDDLNRIYSIIRKLK